MTADTLGEFRLSVRRWITESLPLEWRDISRGTDEAEAVRIRRTWGAKLAEGGWAAPQWPVEYGGRGLSMERHIVVLEELVNAGAPEALNSNGIGICGPVLIRHGTEEQRRRYLSPMLDHSELWCQGFSEPHAGSDLASLQTRARLDGDHFVVTGQKLWTSFARQCDFCYALVRTNPEMPGHAGISFLILDLHAEGVSIRPLRNIAGGQEFAEVFYDDVVVPRSNLVGELNSGWRLAMEALALERGLSFAERAMRLQRELGKLLEMIPAINSSRGIDQPPGAELRTRIVDSYVSGRGLHSLVRRVLFLMDDPEAAGALASLAKLYWSETHQELLRIALDLLGEQAGAPEHAEWLRAFLFSRGETIYGGTSEVQRNAIARSLGLPSSRTAS